MTAQIVARRLVVHGQVQGVWFRASCRDEARRLGVMGWACNDADGSVQVHAEGAPDAVAQLVAWTHLGPPRAEVARVEESGVAPVGAADFEVR